MIHDVDESLRALVRREALNGSGVEIAFDAPTKDWVARRNAPIVDLYLYDIREDTTRRRTSWEDVRDEHGRTIGQRLPPRRYRLSYLVTAWTNRPEDEHRLLSAMLACFVQHEYLPADVLAGTLADQELPVLVTVALPPAEDRTIADVWSAMGGELKPSLDLVVTAPMDIARQLEVGPPVLEEPRLVVGQPGTTPDAAAGSAPGRRRKGGEEGSAAPAAQKPAHALVRLPAASATEGAAEETPDETVVAGSADQPGRRIRLRALERP